MNSHQFESYLRKKNIILNEQQSKAVQAVSGPTLLLAVPGSGKTTTLISRIGYMVFCCGIDPSKILTLTYTNAATGDMQRRFREIFGMQEGVNVRFQTINSLCNGIINAYVGRMQGDRFELVPDTAGIISQVYRNVYQEYPTEGDVSEAARAIAYIKNMRLSEEERATIMIGEYDAEPLYNAYIRYMREHRLMDFDDQLTIALQILVKYPDILKMVRDRYPYILVDEAQDTSKIQHEIVELMAGGTPNLFMVGDEDQSIYGFRAAYPQALLDFEKKYQGAEVLLLEENYRSTQRIVESAGKFIAINRKRKEKHMFTGRPEGPGINYIQLDSRYGQYAYLMKCLEDVKTDTAVLMRNNDSAIPLIYYLRKQGIPYQSRGMETSFFTHKVVRDVRDFTAFARDPADAEVFLRIYYKTGLKIKREHAMDVVRQFNPDRDRSMFHTYQRLYGKKNTREKIRKVIDEFAALKKDSAWEAIGRIEYQLRRTEERDREKFFILRILTERGEHMDHFLQKLDRLKQVIAERTADPRAQVFVSTVHSAKGLEYSDVYIIDAIDGIMPASDAEDIEEERRIFYVAMTRAKNRLNIMCYKDQKMPFVEVLQGRKKSGGIGVGESSGRKNPVKSSGSRPAGEFFRKGDRVRHVTIGRGTVVGLEDDKVIVKFDSGRRTKILAEYSVENNLMSKTR